MVESVKHHLQQIQAQKQPLRTFFSCLLVLSTFRGPISTRQSVGGYHGSVDKV